ncbi:MAG: hypothetical protein Q9201_002582, partial [Fulgogasparrea decipioides]
TTAMDVDDQPIYQIRQRGQLKDVATIIILGTNAQEVLAEEHDECGFESVEADYMVDDVASRRELIALMTHEDAGKAIDVKS